MSDNNALRERKQLEHKMWVRIAENWRRQRELAEHRPTTQNPEPPGSGSDWEPVGDGVAFAAAGLCELWRMDLEDRTAFFRFSDFPPSFNFSGMWWRMAS
jgi:hypothetical protein